jgi:hypothetical protein
VKNKVRIALAFALVLGGAGLARAQTSQSGQAPPAPNDMRKEMKQDVQKSSQSAMQQIDQLRVVKLTVKDVNPQNHKVTVDVQVSPEANFQSQTGTPIQIDQLKPGDTVSAAFDPKTGEMVSAKVTPSASNR